MSMRRIFQIFGIASFCAFIGIEAWCNRVLVTKAFDVKNLSWRKFVQTIHNGFPRNFSGKVAWIDGNGFVARFMGRRVSNGVMKYREGILGAKAYPFLKQRKRLEALCCWADFLKRHGIGYCYVQTPLKLDRSLEILPQGCNPRDYGIYKGIDELMNGLAEAGISALDLSQSYAKTLEQIKRNFYATDFHWKYETAFDAFPMVARQLMPFLGEDASRAFLQFSLSNWESVTYSGDFLGSWGKRTGEGFCVKDDFTYFVPKFKTEFDFFIEDLMLYRQGTFAETIIEPALTVEDLNPYESNRYCVYFRGNYGYMCIRSRLAPIRAHIVVIKDSHAHPVIAYLATIFSEIDVIDPRHYKKSIAQRVLEVHPDVVLSMHGVRSQQNEMIYYDFGPYPQDFTAMSVMIDRSMDIKASTNSTNYAIITPSFVGGAKYRLSYAGVKQFGWGGSGGLATIVLHDKKTNRSIDKHYILGNEKDGCFEFFVSSDVEQPRLLFYAAVPGKAKGKGVRFERIRLERLKPVSAR